MPLTVFRNSGKNLKEATGNLNLSGTGGWWNTVSAVDFDSDGDMDLVAGNLGANSVFHASPDAPLELYVHDFDDNNRSDPIIAEHREGGLYTWARRDELLNQLPGLFNKIPSYSAYAEMTLQELVDAEKLENARHKQVHSFNSAYFENRGSEGFERLDLPVEAQFAPVRRILPIDYNEDGNPDLLLGGNFFGSDTKQGRYDASYGTLLAGDGRGNFEPVGIGKSGIFIRGEVRDIETLNDPQGPPLILIARNDNTLLFYRETTATD